MQEIVTQVIELRSQRTVNQHRDQNRSESLPCLGWRDIQKKQGCSTPHRLRLPRDSQNHNRNVKKCWCNGEDADACGDPSGRERAGEVSNSLASPFLPPSLQSPTTNVSLWLNPAVRQLLGVSEKRRLLSDVEQTRKMAKNGS